MLVGHSHWAFKSFVIKMTSLQDCQVLWFQTCQAMNCLKRLFFLERIIMYFPSKIIILFSLVCWLINGVCWWITAHSRSERTLQVYRGLYIYTPTWPCAWTAEACVCISAHADFLMFTHWRVWRVRSITTKSAVRTSSSRQLCFSAAQPTDSALIRSYVPSTCRTLHLRQHDSTSHNHIVSAPSQPPPAEHTPVHCSEH